MPLRPTRPGDFPYIWEIYRRRQEKEDEDSWERMPQPRAPQPWDIREDTEDVPRTPVDDGTVDYRLAVHSILSLD